LLAQILLAANAEELQAAARALAARKPLIRLRALAMPLTPEDYHEAGEAGTLSVLAAAGWIILWPGTPAALAPGEAGVTTLEAGAGEQKLPVAQAALRAVTG